jgi:hypothetical protein
LLFFDGIGDFGSLAEKVKVLSNASCLRRAAAVAKCIVVESIVGFVELIA